MEVNKYCGLKVNLYQLLTYQSTFFTDNMKQEILLYVNFCAIMFKLSKLYIIYIVYVLNDLFYIFIAIKIAKWSKDCSEYSLVKCKCIRMRIALIHSLTRISVFFVLLIAFGRFPSTMTTFTQGSYTCMRFNSLWVTRQKAREITKFQILQWYLHF